MGSEIFKTEETIGGTQMAERVDNPIGYLFDANYNPKIEAVIAARKKIVEGAVSSA